eukprot:1183058-Prorocentrum_minimum.AAC.4
MAMEATLRTRHKVQTQKELGAYEIALANGRWRSFWVATLNPTFGEWLLKGSVKVTSASSYILTVGLNADIRRPVECRALPLSPDDILAKPSARGPNRIRQYPHSAPHSGIPTLGLDTDM